MRKNLFPLIFGGFLSLVGIVLFISSFFWLKSGLTFKKDAVEVTAEISAIESYRGGCIMLGMGTLFAAIGIIPIIVLSVGFKGLQQTLCKCRENHL